MQRARVLLIVAAAPVLAGATLGCETVDPGPPPSDINACRPSQTYYVGSMDDAGMTRSIWVDVLDKDYGGKKCHDAACHGAGSTNSLRLSLGGAVANCTPPGCIPPIPLTQDWDANYRSTAEQMNCSNVSASKLLVYPSGLMHHFGGKLFEPNGPEADIIIGWVGAQP